jgi:hypothetical protein
MERLSNSYLAQQGLSTMYNVIPGLSEFRQVNPYTMTQSEDTFLNRECNRKLKLTELLRFTDGDINKFVFFFNLLPLLL